MGTYNIVDRVITDLSHHSHTTSPYWLPVQISEKTTDAVLKPSRSLSSGCSRCDMCLLCEFCRYWKMSEDIVSRSLHRHQQDTFYDLPGMTFHSLYFVTAHTTQLQRNVSNVMMTLFEFVSCNLPATAYRKCPAISYQRRCLYESPVEYFQCCY